MKPALAGFAAALVALPLAAGAAPGMTTAPVYLRAGPSPAYPVVTTLPPNAQIEVLGCAEGWAWCDVAWGAARGWVSAGYLAFPYAGPPSPLYSYGPSIGLAIVPFEFGPYWGRYYRDRPWYAERDRWGRPPPPRYAAPPPRPAPQRHAAPPPRHAPQHQAAPQPHPRPSSAPPPANLRPPPAQAGPPPRHSGPSQGAGGPPPQAGRPSGPGGPPSDRGPRSPESRRG